MKKYILFLLIFIILILAGCATLNPPGGKEGPLTGSPNGIQIRFLPEQPSSELFEGSEVNVGLELKNNAACNARGKLCVNDLAPSSRGGIIEPLCNDFELLGATLENGKSKIEKTNFYINIPPYKGLDRPEGLQVTLEAAATYNCRITAGPYICIRRTSGEDSSCVNGQTITGSGLRAAVGPITISKVVKKFSTESGQVRLVADITLSKMSDGYVSNEAAIQNPLALSQEDPINVNVDFGGIQMDCTGRDFRDNKLYWKATDSNDKTIKCTTLTNVVDRLEDYLNVNLDYVYKTTESKSIKITKLTQNT